MGLRVSKEFGSRGPSKTEDPKKKFIFVFEGEKTEKQYFEGLFNNRTELGIKDLIDIRTLEREDGTRSNQMKVVQELHNSLQEVLILKGNHSEVLEIVKSVLESLQIPNSSEIENVIKEALTGKDVLNHLQEVVDIIEELGIEGIQLSDFIGKLTNLSGLLDYDENYDTICIIIDRDWQSFKENQYDTVLQICNDNHYKLGITNPCFEFWLLLHIKDCKEYDENVIKMNRRKTKNRRYVESLLVEELHSYRKNKLKFEVFKSGIRDAIEREKLYCEDVVLLKDNVGSSVGKIVASLLL